MGKRKGEQANSEASDQTGGEPDKPVPQMSQNESPEGLAKIDAPELVPPQAQQIAEPAPIATSAPPDAPPASAAAIELPKAQAPNCGFWCRNHGRNLHTCNPSRHHRARRSV